MVKIHKIAALDRRTVARLQWELVDQDGFSMTLRRRYTTKLENGNIFFAFSDHLEAKKEKKKSMENHPIREQDNININFIKETEYVSFLE